MLVKPHGLDNIAVIDSFIQEVGDLKTLRWGPFERMLSRYSFNFKNQRGSHVRYQFMGKFSVTFVKPHGSDRKLKDLVLKALHNFKELQKYLTLKSA